MKSIILFSIALFFLYAILIFIRAPREFIFLIPLVNALTDMTIGYSNDRIFTIFSVLRAVLIYSVIFLSLKGNWNKKDPLIMAVIFAVGYYFLNVLFSSNFMLSLNSYLRMIISLLMTLTGYLLIRDHGDLLRMNRSYLAALSILILNFIVAQIFKIGSNPYDELETQFYLGGGGVQLITSLPFILFTFPLAMVFVKKPAVKILYLFLSLIAIIIVLVAMKRIVVAALAVGFSISLYFSVSSKRILISFVIVLGILYATLPLYEDIIINRAKRIQETNLQEEKQAKDFNWYLDDLKENPHIFFFGREFLNSRDTIGKRQRGLHVDYIILLHGAGIVGLMLYLNILYQIIRKYIRLRRFYREDLIYKTSRTTFWALILCVLTISLSGGIVGITARSYAFLYLGLFLGYLAKGIPFRDQQTTEVENNAKRPFDA